MTTKHAAITVPGYSWSAATIKGKLFLFLQADDRADSKRPWIEVINGDRGYQVTKYRENDQGGDHVMRELNGLTWEMGNSPTAVLARELDMPGAGYAIQRAEALLSRRTVAPPPSRRRRRNPADEKPGFLDRMREIISQY